MRGSENAVAWAVVAAVFVAFLPSLGNDFVNWDDTSNLVSNPHFQDLSWASLRWMLADFHLGHYQPLTWLSWAADRALWGLNPFGFHLTNLLLHCANAALVFRLARRLLGDGALPAAAAALFFALHPLRVESVAWATERRDVLSAFFYLLAILAHLGGSPRRALLACSLALASKVTALTFPAVLVILDFHLGRAPLKGKWPFAALAVAFAALGLLAQSVGGSLPSLAQRGPSSRLLQSAFAPSFYLAKTLWPAGLSPWYGLSQLAHLGPPAAAATAALTSLAWLLRARAPWVLAAWAAYVAALFPSLGLVQSGQQIAADRFTYLASVVLALVGGAALKAAGRRVSQAWLALLVAAMAGGLSLCTWRQTMVWRDTVSLWSHALALDPAADIPDINLAVGLLEEGRTAEAVARLERRLGIQPTPEVASILARVLHNQGVEAAQGGDRKAARAALQRALLLDPSLEESRQALARLKMVK